MLQTCIVFTVLYLRSNSYTIPVSRVIPNNRLSDIDRKQLNRCKNMGWVNTVDRGADICRESVDLT